MPDVGAVEAGVEQNGLLGCADRVAGVALCAPFGCGFFQEPHTNDVIQETSQKRLERCFFDGCSLFAVSLTSERGAVDERVGPK